MSSKQNKPLTIGLCSEPGTGKTQFVYQFISDVLALNAQSGAPEGLDGDAKKYYQKLSAEIEKGVLSPTRDEKSFSVSLSDKAETSLNVKLRQYNFYDESGDSFVNYVEDDEKSDDIFNQLINNSDVLIYTINPASPEFASETYSQTLQEHIHQLLKTIAKKRGNRYLPVYFLFTHKNELDAAPEDDRAVVQKQIDSLMAFVKQEYQNRYNRTFPKDLASPKAAFGTFDLKRPGSALQVMEETLNLHACLERFDKKFRARSRIVYIPLAIILIGLAIAIFGWFLPQITGQTKNESLEGIERRVSKLEEQYKDFSEKIDNFEKTISKFNPDDIKQRLKKLENTVNNLPNFGTQIEGINQELETLKKNVNNIPDYKDRIEGINQELETLKKNVNNIPDYSTRINDVVGRLEDLKIKSRDYGTQFDDINNNYKKLDSKVNNIPNYGTQIEGINQTLGTHENRISAIEKKPNATPAPVPSGDGNGAQIEAINKKLDNHENRLSDIEKKPNATPAPVPSGDSNGSQIDGIKKTLGEHENRISAIEKKPSASPAIVPAPPVEKPNDVDYGTQIKGLNTRLGTLEDNFNNIPNYNQQITDIKKQITELRGKVNTPDYSEQIQKLNNRIEELESKIGTEGTQFPSKNMVIDGKDKYGDYKKITYNGLTFVFRYCKPCKQGFPMGENNNITVKLYPGFWILESEVTNEMWKEIMGNCPSDNKAFNYPVDQVSWEQCNKFCSLLSEKINKACNTKFKFQLPTEAQWEYACRTGKKLNNDKQSILNEIGNTAWYKDNSNGTIHRVKMQKPNDWGIYDMCGNVHELVRDGWTNKLVSADNPIAVNDKDCVYRGGSYEYSWGYTNWFYRYSINKSKSLRSYGFRICIEGAESDNK